MPPKRPSALRRVLLLLKNHKKKALLLVVLIALSQSANISVPFIIKVIIDSLTNYIKNGGSLPFDILVYSAIGILIATITSSSLQSSYNYHLFKLVTKIEDRLRSASFSKYLELHALFHHSSSSGQIIGRIERGGIAIYAILNDIIGQNLLPPLVVFLGTFSVLLYKNVWIALAILIPFPIYLLVTRQLSRRIYEIEQRANDAFEELSKESYDIAGNVLTVKKFSQEAAETEHKDQLLSQAREIQYSAERLWAVIENIQTVISTIGRVSVLVLSGWFVLAGRATIGEFVLYVTLQNMAYQPLSQLSNTFPRLRRNITRVERMFTILDEPVNVVDIPDAPSLPPLKNQIEFKNVWFSYHKDSQWALKNIQLVIPAGSTLALVGRSGSGKTTFINLLLRSFDPQKGQILFDGADIKTITQDSLRAQIAVVPQEVDLFSRTVAENISYGSPEVTKSQIINAAKTALAHDFILKLEHGYKTIVGERGIKLSGGERQRIGIARAVLRDPKILILDEATSSLDTESERLIAQATDALIKNRTSIIIAHRLSTVIHANRIVVFKNNQIEAVGAHEKLLEISPTYRKLYSLQFADME
ncbi:MAG: ABC transporter ATP-binding protein [Patescibacteria group bacterium]